jgi:hypothetical protein
VERAPALRARAQERGVTGKWLYTVSRPTPALRAISLICVAAGPRVRWRSIVASLIRRRRLSRLGVRFLIDRGRFSLVEHLLPPRALGAPDGV